MSSDPAFRCPVCRARQTLQAECRRCQADLRLVVRAHRRVAFLTAQMEQARKDEDQFRQQALAAELNLLAPQQSSS